MNKIMQLTEAYAIVSKNWGDGDVKLGAVSDARSALQAEVTRLEMELAHWKEARQSAIDAGELMKVEITEAKVDIKRYVRIASEQGVKLAALEGELKIRNSPPEGSATTLGLALGHIDYYKAVCEKFDKEAKEREALLQTEKAKKQQE